MANMTKEYWNRLSKDERDALIKALSIDNVLTGRGPSFQDYCVVKEKENTVTLTKNDLRARTIALFVWGFMFGVGVAGFILQVFTN